jgi:hypothetical protein
MAMLIAFEAESVLAEIQICSNRSARQRPRLTVRSHSRRRRICRAAGPRRLQATHGCTASALLVSPHPGRIRSRRSVRA